MAEFKRIEDAGDLTGKVALARVDFNVPMADGKITDDTRLVAAVETVKALREAGAKVALMAHFGRPKGEKVPEMSLAPVATPFAQVLGHPVSFCEDCKGETAKEAIEKLDATGVILLENTRYYKGEEKNDPELAKEIAELGDVFVSDAFSAAHRAHVSTVGLADYLPAFAGKSMERELDALNAALGQPERPVVAVVGGAKVSSKIDLLKNLVSKVDYLVIGGGMANTFLAAQGVDVGKSLCEHDLTDTAKEIEANAKAAGCEIVLPVDLVVAKDFAANAANRTIGLDEVESDEMILDAGPASVARLETVMKGAKTLIWNGPLGAFELTPFDAATVAAAKAAGALAKSGDLVAVAGGGDTVAALNHAGAAGDFTFISTAGGAFLEWMEGKELPGVEALKK
ncbi:MAG: phosphoglycerate kinase [Ponticaulis sp.]|nr:phosphoglycerate kinase [Ponticaulis sp.]|tara:strand:- start:14900 stop:16096 length:1197 start_codon:yes stop_codon:yes gene_type:complete